MRWCSVLSPLGSKGMGPWALTGALEIEDSWRNRMQISLDKKMDGYPIPDPNPKYFSIPDPYPINFQNHRVFWVSGIREKPGF